MGWDREWEAEQAVCGVPLEVLGSAEGLRGACVQRLQWGRAGTFHLVPFLLLEDSAQPRVN